MKKVKSLLSLLLIICITLSLVGCDTEGHSINSNIDKGENHEEQIKENNQELVNSLLMHPFGEGTVEGISIDFKTNIVLKNDSTPTFTQLNMGTFEYMSDCSSFKGSSEYSQGDEKSVHEMLSYSSVKEDGVYLYNLDSEDSNWVYTQLSPNTDLRLFELDFNSLFEGFEFVHGEHIKNYMLRGKLSPESLVILENSISALTHINTNLFPILDGVSNSPDIYKGANIEVNLTFDLLTKELECIDFSIDFTDSELEEIQKLGITVYECSISVNSINGVNIEIPEEVLTSAIPNDITGSNN